MIHRLTWGPLVLAIAAIGFAGPARAHAAHGHVATASITVAADATAATAAPSVE